MTAQPRWLLNENFPQPAVKLLRELGWDIAAISEDQPSINDETVLERARQENRVLVTFDRDYGELVFKRKLPAPRMIVLLRVIHYQPTDPAEWLIELQAARQLVDGYFHIFDGQSMRRRPLLETATGGSA